MGPLQVELVAADRLVWEGEAKMVSARGIEGELGIMADHTPLLTVLAGGEVRIEREGMPQETAHIDGGLLSVDGNRVTIVAETVRTALSG